MKSILDIMNKYADDKITHEQAIANLTSGSQIDLDMMYLYIKQQQEKEERLRILTDPTKFKTSDIELLRDSIREVLDDVPK